MQSFLSRRVGMVFALTLLLSVLVLSAAMQAQGKRPPVARAEIAVTLVADDSLGINTTNRFWMEGASAEVGYSLTPRISLAADYAGTHAASISNSGVPITLSFLSFGPRFRRPSKWRTSVYAEGLLGVALG